MTSDHTETLAAPTGGARGLRFLVDGFATFTSWLNSLGSVWVFGLMLFVCADIIGRNIFNAPLKGVTEILSYSMVGIVFLQLANTLHVGRFTRAEIFINMLDSKRPAVGALLNGVFTAAGAAIFTLLAWLSYDPMIKSIVEMEIDGKPLDFTLVVWPFRVMVFVGSVATAVIFAVQTIDHFISMRRHFMEAFASSGVIRTGWPAALAFVAVILGAWLLSASGASAIVVGLFSILFMLVLIAFGMHIGVALMLLGFFGIWFIRGRLGIAERTLYHAGSEFLRNHVLAVIPLFVFMGLIVGATDMGRETYDVARWVLRRLKGGLGVATVAANAIFAAITGSSIASAAVFTKIATPEMLRHGYTPQFSVGVVAGTSVLGMLIPPSLLLIIYAFLSEQSVGILFIAAIIPGLILAVAMGLGIVFMSHKMPQYVGGNVDIDEEFDETIVSALMKLFPIVLLILVVLGGIYGGILTPAEAGAAGAAGALIIALMRRRLNWQRLWTVLVETGHVTVAILFLILAANVYSKMIAMSGLPQYTSHIINEANLGLIGFMIAYVALLIVLGMVLDSVSIMLIVLPLAVPVAQALGGDLVWFGIVSVIAIEIGLLTPPVGLTCYVVKSTLDDPRISLGDIFKGAFPFALVMLAVTALLIAFPVLSTVFV